MRIGLLYMYLLAKLFHFDTPAPGSFTETAHAQTFEHYDQHAGNATTVNDWIVSLPIFFVALCILYCGIRSALRC